MTSPIITVESLGKAYRIGLKEEVPDTLVGAATSWLKAPLRNFNRLRKLNTFSANGDNEKDIIWALRDVSFDVAEGEVLGIIGRNGAGKSTLLKILSRITEPTCGRAVIHGRVSSLLEVGTGFHPELSGRENIYMNGTILGMRKKEIDRKLEAIIDFSGVEKFLDTPIKRYSSGMKVRLAFSVAAHLEPEILIIDEVLAVGDAEFQKKCLGKMRDVASGGRTVLFVSHNLAAVESLCSRAILLNGGKTMLNGDVEEVISRYVNALQCPGGCRLDQIEDRTGSLNGKFTEILFLNDNDSEVSVVKCREPLRILIRFQCKEFMSGISVGAVVSDAIGRRLFRMQSNEMKTNLIPLCNRGQVEFRIESLPLVPGLYSVTVGLSRANAEKLDHIPDAASFSVVEADVFDTGRCPSEIGGAFLVDATCEYKA